MRLLGTPASLLYLLISRAQYISAGPLPKEGLERGEDRIQNLFGRQAYCAGQYCGISSQYCCTGGSTCYTDAQTVARCGAPTALAAQQSAGSWVFSTVTTVLPQLVTVVNTVSSYVGVPTTQNLFQSTAICTNSLEMACGAMCCPNGYYCYASGNCAASVPTTAPSAPSRQTPSTIITTAVLSVSVSTTQTFLIPTSTAAQTGNGTAITQTSAGGGLSGGAIAGIVIGVLAGIAILIAVCFCCILKTGFDAILSLFGLGKDKRRERVEVTEERYSRRGSASSRRDTHNGWFGGGGGRSKKTEKKKSGIGEVGTLATIALSLAALWACLGIRRRNKEKARPPRSEASYSYYTDSYSGAGTSESSVSSEPRSQRTRDTRRTRETRETRETRRVSSRPR